MAENIPPPLPRHVRTVKLSMSEELSEHMDPPTFPSNTQANQEPHVLPETRLEQETKRPPAEQRPEKETKKAPVESKKDERKPIKQEHTEEYDEMANPYDLAGYEKISKIGEGTYGVVFKAKQKETNKLVALKKIRLNLQEGVPTTTIREVAILKEMDHKNIVRLVDMIQRDATIYLVFDYSEVDLRRYMDKARRPGLTANHIKSFMHQLLLGLHYCHSHRILHRDLKPQNLLIDKYGRLTIADLGLSRAFGVPMRTYTHQVITLWYRAPEILLGSRHYSTAVDMWSVGCIMAEMITLRALFPGSTQIDELFRIFQVLGTPTEAMWPGITTLPDYNEHFPPWKPRDLKETIEEYPHSIKDLPDSAYDLLRSLLSYDPVTRISAARAEEHMYFYDDITMLAL